MESWQLPQKPTLRFALHKGQNLPLIDFLQAWSGMVVVTIEKKVSHIGKTLCYR